MVNDYFFVILCLTMLNYAYPTTRCKKGCSNHSEILIAHIPGKGNSVIVIVVNNSVIVS